MIWYKYPLHPSQPQTMPTHPISFIFLPILLTSLYPQTCTCSPFNSTSPVWLTSNYFRAGYRSVISSLTGNNTTPTYTFTFSSSLPAVPKLAYGVKGYMGNDYLGVQEFEIRRVNLTASSYTVAVQIKGTTNIHLLTVSYIAVDPNFPHHLNSFDGVPVNYNNGALTNITTRSLTQTKYYSNIVNYTLQAASQTHNTFSLPLSNNRILLLLMAMSIAGRNQGTSTVWYPCDIHANAQILSPQTYNMSVSLSINNNLYYYIFSQIILDVADVQSSNKYTIVTDRIDFPNAGGFYQLPQEFVDNFIMGLTDFSTPRCQSVIGFNWIFTTINNTFGVQVNYSLPYQDTRLGPYALTRQGASLFYIKTWQCPTNYQYFNLSSNLCQSQCGDYNYQLSTNYTCQYCSYSCLQCASSVSCTQCSYDVDHRVLKNGRTCQCIYGYYPVTGSHVCQPCAVLVNKCVDCYYNTTYNSSDSTLSRQYGCLQCQHGYYLLSGVCVVYRTCASGYGPDLSSNVCYACSRGCVSCMPSINCTACVQGYNYFLVLDTQYSSNTYVCQMCSVQGCSVCSSLTTCSACLSGSGYTLTPSNTCTCPNGTFSTNSTCTPCSPYCLTCTGPSSYQCTSCNKQYNRLLIGSQCQCDDYNYKQSTQGANCTLIDLRLCNRGYVYVQSKRRCQQLCGDGWHLSLQCDDGNVINSDGCSDACKIEDGFSCQAVQEISICKMVRRVQFKQVQVSKDLQSNTIYFDYDIQPDSVIYTQYQLNQILHFRGGALTIISAVYLNGHLYITANYSRNLQGRDVLLQIRQNYQYNSSYDVDQSIYNTSKVTFMLPEQKVQLITNNNLQVNNYNKDDYQQRAKTKKGALAILILGLFMAFGCLFLKNSLSVMVTVNALQVCYLSLVTIDGMSPTTSALLIIKPILGYNKMDIFQEDNGIDSARVRSLGFGQSFANNFNVMFLVQLGVMLMAFLIYLASNKKPFIKMVASILQREALLMIIFNMPTVFFSLTLISQPTTLNVVFSIASGVIIILQVGHLVMRGGQYWAFKQVFDLTSKGHFKKFIIIYFLARLGSCLSLSYISFEPLKSLIAGAAFEGGFILFISFFRPFYQFMNNIFMIVGELMAISFFASVYASEALDLQQRQMSISVMIYVLGALVFAGLGNLIYSAISDLQNSGKKLKAFNDLIEAKENAKQEIDQNSKS